MNKGIKYYTTDESRKERVIKILKRIRDYDESATSLINKNAPREILIMINDLLFRKGYISPFTYQIIDSFCINDEKNDYVHFI